VKFPRHRSQTGESGEGEDGKVRTGQKRIQAKMWFKRWSIKLNRVCTLGDQGASFCNLSQAVTVMNLEGCVTSRQLQTRWL
jgi:hypothetical protein